MPQPRTLILCALLAAGFLWPAGTRATTWDVEASVSDERKTEVTDDGSDRTETFEQSYTITYETDVTPALNLSLDFSLDITDEINEGPEPDSDFDTREIKPSIDVDFQAVWWDLTATWENTQKTSNDPNQADSRDTTWDVEFTAEPEGEVAPDVKVKFQRDRTAEDGDERTRDDSWEATLDYSFWDLLDLSFDAKKETNRNIDNLVVTFVPTNEVVDRLDQVQEDRSYKIDVSLDRELWEGLKVEAAWTSERQQTVEFFTDSFLDIDPPVIKDEIRSREDTLKNNLKGKITYTLLEDLELSLDREVDWNKDLEIGLLEVTDTWTGTVTYTRSFTDTIDVDLSYDDERKDTRGTQSASYAITRDYGVAVEFSPLKNLTLSPSFDRSDTVEWFEDTDQQTSDSVDDTWEVELDTGFWDDQIEFVVTRTFNDTREGGRKTTKERNWDVDVSFSFEGVPNLEFNPQYTYTDDEDVLKGTSDLERKWEVSIAYELKLGNVTTIGLDHSYSRTSSHPAEGLATIQRDDDSDVTLTLDGFLKGMALEFGLTRTAADESGDDKGPTVDYTYNITYDFEFLENYTLSFEYNFDKKGEGDDTLSLQTTFSMEFLDGLLAVDLEHEFEEQREGDKKDTHRYLIEVTGKF